MTAHPAGPADGHGIGFLQGAVPPAQIHSDSWHGPSDAERLAVFVQEYVKHESQPDAGVIAVIRSCLRGPFVPAVMAERTLARPEVQAAITAARSFYKPRTTTDVTPQSLTDDLETVFQKAIDDKQYAPAINAKRLQADLYGLTKTTVDVNITHRVEDMSTAELQRIAARAKTVDAEFTEVADDEPAGIGTAGT